MMNSAFAGVGASGDDYYPVELRDEIEGLNAEIYERVNNGVYKAGFARTQEAYEDAVRPLFATLDRLEERLASRRYLCGERITEADWRLFTTLVRFDAVYLGHFKCNLRRLIEYPNLWAYTRELYQWTGVREDREPRTHQAALLRQPRIHQPAAPRPDRPGAGLRRAARPRPPARRRLRRAGMGISVDGLWMTDEDLARADVDHRATHVPTVLRNWVTADGSPGPTGEEGFKAEAGRYHLYVAWNCPWAHRTLILRIVKGLEGLIGVSVTRPERTDQGWVFDAGGGVRRSAFRLGRAARGLRERRARLQRSGHRAGALRPRRGSRRQQRVGRHRAHVERRLRGHRAGEPGLLPRRSPTGDRRVETPSSIRTSTRASTERASPRPRPPTSLRRGRCSGPWTSSRPD